MADRFILTHVKRLPLFQDLTPQQVEIIANEFQVVSFEPEQLVARQGEAALGLWLLVSGQGVLIQTGQDGVQRNVGSIAPGNYVGEKALFKDMREVASLQIVQPAILLFLGRERLAVVMARYPEIKIGLEINRQSGRNQNSHKVAAKAFEEQREDETVLLIKHKHWWAFVRLIWVAAILAALLVGIGVALASVPLLTAALLGLAVVGPGIVMLYFYFEWRDDLVIITDQRIIHMEDEWMLFRKHVSEVPLDSIIEVNYEIPSSDPLAYSFKYGTVVVKTPGAAGNMVLEFMTNPKQLQEIIFANRQRLKDRVSEAGRAAIRAEIERSLHGKPKAPPASVQNLRTETNVLAPLRPTSIISTHFINEAGESVYRKHILNWFGHILAPSLVIIGGFVLILLSLFNPNLQSVGAVGISLGVLFLIVGALWFYAADWDWRNDVYVVGNSSIKLIRKRPLWFQNEHDQISLKQIDNVVSDVSGPLNSLFQRGNVMLFLVGADTNNAKVFADVHNPREIQEEISRKQALAREQSAEEEAHRQRQAITEYLAVYHETVAPPQAQQPAPAEAPPPPPPVMDEEQPPPPMRDAVRPPRVPKPKVDSE